MKIKVLESGIRIDKYLTNTIDYTRSQIQNMIKNNQVLLNGINVSSNTMVKENDEIEINIVNRDITLEKENIDLDIVYEDAYLIIINKKSGMVVHPAPGNYTSTLVNALLYHFDNFSKMDSNRPGIVHRIDKDTSGVLVVAKDEKTHYLLSEMIKNKEIERKYIALVKGVINHDTGTIDAPIGRDINNRQKYTVTDVNAKDAITHFKVLKRYNDYTLIECLLDTGRTHQIRVHMNYINHAIYNDPVYSKTKNQTEFGQFLHSKSIKFIHPITHEEIFVETELPKEFNDFLDILNKEE